MRVWVLVMAAFKGEFNCELSFCFFLHRHSAFLWESTLTIDRLSLHWKSIHKKMDLYRLKKKRMADSINVGYSLNSESRGIHTHQPVSTTYRTRALSFIHKLDCLFFKPHRYGLKIQNSLFTFCLSISMRSVRLPEYRPLILGMAFHERRTNKQRVAR